MKACVSAVLLASSLMAWGAAIQAEPLTVAQIKELLHRRDSGAGLREVEAAAEAGDPNAQLFLATLYLGEGKGPKHGAEADKWLHSAAASGNSCAMTMLGLHGVEGVGMEVGNAPEALQWLKKAAVRGAPIASKLLLTLHDRGEPVSHDEAEVAAWRRTVVESPTPRQKIETAEHYLTNVWTARLGRRL